MLAVSKARIMTSWVCRLNISLESNRYMKKHAAGDNMVFNIAIKPASSAGLPVRPRLRGSRYTPTHATATYLALLPATPHMWHVASTRRDWLGDLVNWSLLILSVFTIACSNGTLSRRISKNQFTVIWKGSCALLPLFLQGRRVTAYRFHHTARGAAWIL